MRRLFFVGGRVFFVGGRGRDVKAAPRRGALVKQRESHEADGRARGRAKYRSTKEKSHPCHCCAHLTITPRLSAGPRVAGCVVIFSRITSGSVSSHPRGLRPHFSWNCPLSVSLLPMLADPSEGGRVFPLGSSGPRARVARARPRGARTRAGGRRRGGGRERARRARDRGGSGPRGVLPRRRAAPPARQGDAARDPLSADRRARRGTDRKGRERRRDGRPCHGTNRHPRDRRSGAATGRAHRGARAHGGDGGERARHRAGDVTTRAVVESLDLPAMYENALTATFLERARLPLVAADERAALRGSGAASGDLLLKIQQDRATIGGRVPRVLAEPSPPSSPYGQERPSGDGILDWVIESVFSAAIEASGSVGLGSSGGTGGRRRGSCAGCFLGSARPDRL